MLEAIIEYLKAADPSAVYLFLFLIAFAENVFPPIPGDLPVAFIGYLIPQTSGLSFTLSVLVSSVASTLGFLVLFLLSRTAGLKIYNSAEAPVTGWFARMAHKLFPPSEMETARERFSTHGYLAVLINRFLFGSRAVISIMTGFMHLKILPVTILAFISSVIWYILLLWAGYLLGENWQQVGSLLTAYTIPLTIIIVLIISYLLWRKKRGDVVP